MAVECGFDCLRGTIFFDSILDYCKQHNLRYMPFVGKITGRPSVLEGTIDGMIEEANSLLAKGVYGIDLLGYRSVSYTHLPMFCLSCQTNRPHFDAKR